MEITIDEDKGNIYDTEFHWRRHGGEIRNDESERQKYEKDKEKRNIERELKRGKSEEEEGAAA